MNKFAWVMVVVALAATLVVGCGKETGDSGKGAVAVVDFVNLQTQLGVSTTVQGYMQKATQDLNEKFNAKAKTHVEEAQKIDADLAAIVKAIPETQRDQKSLAENKQVQEKVKLLQDKQNILREMQAKYQGELNRYRQSLEENWRASLEPAMAKVAEEKGFRVIIPKAGSAFSAAEADLTASLEGYLKKNPPPPFKAPPTEWKGLD